MPRKKIANSQESKIEPKATNKGYIFAVGRRKSAVARVRLYGSSNGKVSIGGQELKKGDIIINEKPIQEYFRFQAYEPIYNEIFQDTGSTNKFVFLVKVEGGGLSSQVSAVVHGVARALDKVDREKYHKILREKGYLTRDARIRERRKVGMGGKARRKKQSPKR